MIRKWMERLIEAMYPTRATCLGCGDERGCSEPFLCDTCRNMLRPAYIVARRDDWKKRGLQWAAFVYYYERPIKGLIRAYKFKGVRMLAENLAHELINLIEYRALGPFDLIIPVPLHPSRRQERGFNQAELLARPLAPLCGAELKTDFLIRTKNTRQQSKLRIGKRTENLMSAFSASAELNGMRILLVDDVVTTGSTLCACAEALKAAGAAEVCAVTLAGSHAWRRGRRKNYRLKKKAKIVNRE